jgi:hypothetical protein
MPSSFAESRVSRSLDHRPGTARMAHDGADMSDRRGPRLSESNRVEAFRDGVFAIAITLLVLELAPPATSGEFIKGRDDAPRL